jgi:hypothetical protein
MVFLTSFTASGAADQDVGAAIMTAVAVNVSHMMPRLRVAPLRRLRLRIFGLLGLPDLLAGLATAGD